MIDFFRQHDTDENNLLDGLEIIKATMHLLMDHHMETKTGSKIQITVESTAGKCPTSRVQIPCAPFTNRDELHQQ